MSDNIHKNDKLENLYEQVQHTSSEQERKKLANEANKVHEKATGHTMKIDQHGNIDTHSKEAKECPRLQ